MESFPDCLESLEFSGKFLDKVKDFQPIQKLSGLSENFPDCMESFSDCLEIFPFYLESQESLELFWKVSG